VKMAWARLGECHPNAPVAMTQAPRPLRNVRLDEAV
jgi:hypothetical protein